jgi:predicted XRE-type DNA-binding protein
MPNPAMRDARAVALAKPPAPTPVFTTDSNGNRTGDRPTVGPASAATIHAGLQAQEALAAAPRPVAQQSIGTQPAGDSADNPTRDLSVQTAAQRVKTYTGKVNAAIDAATQ